ncbi:MAG: hypothetical protein QXU82_02345 [Candidatus Aenigmatarchaeota archaeon]
MSLGKLFWFTAASTAIFLAMYVAGFDLLKIVLALLVINMVVLKASHDEAFEKINFSGFIAGKMEKVEDVVSDLTKFMREKEGFVSKAGDVTLGGIEDAMKKQTESVRMEMNEKLDKMAEKAIEIENRMSDLKKTFSAAVASLDDRLNSVEKPEEIEGVEEPEGAPELPAEGEEAN